MRKNKKFLPEADGVKVLKYAILLPSIVVRLGKFTQFTVSRVHMEQRMNLWQTMGLSWPV